MKTYKDPADMSLSSIVVQMVLLRLRSQTITLRRQLLRGEVVSRLNGRGFSDWPLIGKWRLRVHRKPGREVPAHWEAGRICVLLKKKNEKEFSI